MVHIFLQEKRNLLKMYLLLSLCWVASTLPASSSSLQEQGPHAMSQAFIRKKRQTEGLHNGF